MPSPLITFKYNNSNKLDVKYKDENMEYWIIKVERVEENKSEIIKTFDKEEKAKEIKLDKKPIKGNIVKITIGRKSGKNLTYYIEFVNDNKILQSSKYPKKKSGAVTPFDKEIFRNPTSNLDSKTLSNLLQFYVINSPSLSKQKEPCTAQYFDIKEKWGENCWQKKGSLKPKLVKTIENFNYRVSYRENTKDMKEIIDFQRLNDLDDIPRNNTFCFVNSCNNIFHSIFRHIRNSLAHGRFLYFKGDDKGFLFLEDANQNQVTSRMVIKVQTLLDWIEIIKSPLL